MKDDKKLYIILGNGFTIDFLNHIDPDNKLGIDVQNLFKYGSEVTWPQSQEQGFLSYKYCPNLWNLGARSNLSTAKSYKIIENILTCINAIASIKPSGQTDNQEPNQIYKNAYSELVEYLRQLFVNYNSKVSDTSFKTKITDWPWYKFFKKTKMNNKYSKIYITTYNYDIFLEKVLDLMDFSYSLSGIEDARGKKINIFKPHGSISFNHKIEVLPGAFSISYEDNWWVDLEPEDIIVRTENLEKPSLKSALIPPAGESKRIKAPWASGIRKNAIRCAKNLTKTDDVIICGLSYWHVDRNEIDEILTNFDAGVNVKMYNPSKNIDAFNAVLSSIFRNYIHYTNPNSLEDHV